MQQLYRTHSIPGYLQTYRGILENDQTTEHIPRPENHHDQRNHMKTINYFAAVLVIAAGMATTHTHAQSFEKGTKAINLGFGIGGGYGLGSYYTRVGVIPTFLVAMDVGVADIGPGTLGIGGLVGFNTVQSSYRYANIFNGYSTGTYRSTNLLFGVRGNYHWNEWHNNDKLDTYAGVMMGASVRVSDSYTSNETQQATALGSVVNNPFRHHVYVGARYLFSPNFGVFAEVGHGITYLSGGLTFKF